jgi:hypothetical protein
MREGAGLMNDDLLRAAVSRWRRLALAAVVLLVLSLVALVALALHSPRAATGSGGAEAGSPSGRAGAGEPTADARLRRAADAAGEVARAWAVAAGVSELRVRFAEAEAAQVDLLLNRDEPSVQRWASALKRFEEQTDRVLESAEPGRRESMIQVVVEWVQLARRVDWQNARREDMIAQRYSLRELGGKVRAAIGEAAADAERRVAERAASLESFLRK